MSYFRFPSCKEPKSGAKFCVQSALSFLLFSQPDDMQTRSLCNHSGVEHKPIAIADCGFFSRAQPLFHIFAWLSDWFNELVFLIRWDYSSISYGCTVVLLELYGFFPSQNMFTTLKILALIGGLTFLGGNSLLSNIAARRWAGDETLSLPSPPLCQ